MRSGIYEIKNKLSGKRYVGSAVNLENRFFQHFGKLRANKHPNKHLQSAWNKHGEKHFKFKVLLFCSRTDVQSCQTRLG